VCNRNYYFVVSLLLYINTASSAEYEFTPQLSLSAVYLDNLYLAHGENKTNDIIYEASPQVELTAKGKRLGFDLSYKLQALKYDKSDEDAVYQQLSGKSNVELIENNMFIDAEVSRRQENLSSNQPVSSNNYTVTNNRSDVTTYAITPTIQGRMGDNIEVFASRKYSGVEYEDAGIQKQDKEETKSYIRTTILGGDLHLSLNYFNSYFEANKLEVTRRTLLVDFTVFPTIKLSLEYGNEYSNRDSELFKKESDYKKIGLKWEPNNRSKIDLSYAENIFGITKSADIMLSSKSKTIGLSYNEDVNSGVYEQGQQETSKDNFFSSLDTRLYVSEKYKIYAIKRTAKSEFMVSYSLEEKDYENANSTEEIDAYQFKWNWKLSAKTVFNYSFTSSSIYSDNPEFLNTIKTASYGVSKSLSPSSGMSFNYSKSKQTISDGNLYVETEMASVSYFKTF